MSECPGDRVLLRGAGAGDKCYHAIALSSGFRCNAHRAARGVRERHGLGTALASAAAGMGDRLVAPERAALAKRAGGGRAAAAARACTRLLSLRPQTARVGCAR